MVVTISADDLRSIKALEIAAGPGQWLRVTVRSTGEVAYGIPGHCKSRGPVVGRHQHQLRLSEDFKRHGLSAFRIGLNGSHSLCKHVWAVQL